MSDLAEASYDETSAKALDRKAQMKILKKRGIDFKAKATEDELVSLIVGSNPAEPEQEVVAEEKTPKKVIGEKGYELKVDLSKQYRAGDVLPTEKYEEMKARGINVDDFI